MQPQKLGTEEQKKELVVHSGCCSKPAFVNNYISKSISKCKGECVCFACFCSNFNAACGVLFSWGYRQ